MQLRAIGPLKATQARMLESYKQERREAVTPVDDEAVNAASDMAIGRIDEVVTGDEQFGPHLKVALQRFAGSPPSPTDAIGAVRVCYPAPSRTVGDYAVDEYVGLIAASGLRFALKL